MIYDEDYARRYEDLYLIPWPQKHEVNATILAGLLAELGRVRRPPRWLDLACGQAWHFAALSGQAEMVGIDRSDAQLAHARLRSPEARFVCSDMTTVELPAAGFELVTNFWAGYCYLCSEARIAALLERAVGWLAPGGALYVEVLTPDALASFNDSRYAAGTGFAVTSLSLQSGDWEYEDAGGRHLMLSPPLPWFVDLLQPSFASVTPHDHGGFMIDLVCRGRSG